MRFLHVRPFVCTLLMYAPMVFASCLRARRSFCLSEPPPLRRFCLNASNLALAAQGICSCFPRRRTSCCLQRRCGTRCGVPPVRLARDACGRHLLQDACGGAAPGQRLCGTAVTHARWQLDVKFKSRSNRSRSGVCLSPLPPAERCVQVSALPTPVFQVLLKGKTLRHSEGVEAEDEGEHEENQMESFMTSASPGGRARAHTRPRAVHPRASHARSHTRAHTRSHTRAHRRSHTRAHRRTHTRFPPFILEITSRILAPHLLHPLLNMGLLSEEAALLAVAVSLPRFSSAFEPPEVPLRRRVAGEESCGILRLGRVSSHKNEQPVASNGSFPRPAELPVCLRCASTCPLVHLSAFKLGRPD
eukprot:6208558-Pleurochrysis_carterae.AAC.3